MIDIITHPLFNYIGATIRFLLGTIVRKLLGRKTYTFSECLNGPAAHPYARYDDKHQSNNRLIAAVFLLALIVFISYILTYDEQNRIRTY